MGPEDSYVKCGSDKIRHIVLGTSSSDWKSSVTDGRQSDTADNQCVCVTPTKYIQYIWRNGQTDGYPTALL